MPLKPEVRQFLDALHQAGGPPIDEMTPDDARAVYRLLYGGVVKPHVDAIEDRTIPGPAGEIPVRIYTPSAATSPRPVLVWFHGGGFVIGDLETTDPVARGLAARSGAVVVSVDYRLAPEHPFPAAVDDAFTVVEWVAGHGDELGADPSRLAIGGHSAGANLTAVVTQLVQAARGPQLRLQVLCCPAVDLAGSYPSIDENAEGYLLTKAAMEWFTAQYLGGRDTAVVNPRVSPLLASDLAGLPPAVIVTAEFDPLRDEGQAYAAKLAGAGVDVDHVHYDGEIHDFYTFEGILPDATAALDHLGSALVAALG